MTPTPFQPEGRPAPETCDCGRYHGKTCSAWMADAATKGICFNAALVQCVHEGHPCQLLCKDGECKALMKVDPKMQPPNPKQRYGDLKVPLALVPSASIIYEAEAFAEGARKYGAYNWREKSVEAMTYINASLRHIYALLDGEWIDPECGKPHIGLAKACLGIIADCYETGNLVDNRPQPGKAGQMLRDRTKKLVDQKPCTG